MTDNTQYAVQDKTTGKLLESEDGTQIFNYKGRAEAEMGDKSGVRTVRIQPV